MKLRRYKIALVREALVLLLVLSAQLGLTYFLFSMRDDYRFEAQQLNGQIASLNSQIRALDQQFVKARKSMPAYLEINRKRESAGLTLDRQRVRELVDQLKDVHFMPNVRMSIAPVTESNDKNLERKTARVITSGIGIRFESVSDEETFAFMRALSERLPGTLRAVRFSLTRTQEVNNNLLLAITQRGAVSMVAGDMQFEWFGLRLNGEEAAEGDPPVAAGR